MSTTVFHASTSDTKLLPTHLHLHSLIPQQMFRLAISSWPNQSWEGTFCRCESRNGWEESVCDGKKNSRSQSTLPPYPLSQPGSDLCRYRSDDPVINAGRCALAFTLLLSVPLLTRPCREASANLCRAVWRCCCRKGGDSSSGGEGPSPSSSGSGKENVYEENSFIYSEASESPATSSEPTATTALLADSGPGGVGGVGGGSGDLDRETEDETCVSMCTSLYSDMSALHVGLSVAIPAAALVVATLGLFFVPRPQNTVPHVHFLTVPIQSRILSSSGASQAHR